MEFKEINSAFGGGDPEIPTFKTTKAQCVHCGTTFMVDMVAGKPVFYYDLSNGSHCCSQLCFVKATAKMAEVKADPDFLLARRGVPAILRNADLKNVNEPTIHTFLQDGSRSLLISGPQTGVGKSYAAAACIKYILPHSAWFVTPRGLQEAVSNVMKEGKSSFEVENWAATVDLLVIDDLGTEKMTPSLQATLFSIIEKRVSNGRAMIITTNFTLDELTREYGARIMSRLSTGYLIQMIGEDRRKSNG